MAHRSMILFLSILFFLVSYVSAALPTNEDVNAVDDYLSSMRKQTEQTEPSHESNADSTSVSGNESQVGKNTALSEGAKIAIGVSVGATVLCLILGGIIYFLRKKTKQEFERGAETVQRRLPDEETGSMEKYAPDTFAIVHPAPVVPNYGN